MSTELPAASYELPAPHLASPGSVDDLADSGRKLEAGSWQLLCA